MPIKRLSVLGMLVAVLALPSCRSTSAAVTTTSSTRPELGVVIAQCRRLEDTVTLLNQANSAKNLSGWVLHDEGTEFLRPLDGILLDHNRTYVFMSGPIARGKMLYPEQIHWTPKDVWDDTGDTAYLLNREGDLVDQRDCT